MRRFSPRGLTLVESLVVLAIVGLLIAVLLPAVRSARPAARRNQCFSQIKNLALAMYNYHEEHGTFPPAYTVDENGVKLHSWRSLLLPYLDERALFETIDFTKPWDHPANAEAKATSIPALMCPSALADEGATTYLVVVGSGFVFTGSDPTRLEDIPDGAVNTLLVIDAAAEHAVHWMSPEDADEAMVLAYGEDSEMNHPGVFLGGFADGHCESISIESSSESRRAMLTIAGGEAAPDGEAP